MAITRNKIPCSAARLGLLDPQMIQAVVEASAFQIGKQYLAENRIRIVEADEVQIAAAVIGNSGLYEQTIRLKDGYLLSKCSCTTPEEPICRHCIAVLLEYHRWSQPRQTKQSPAAPEAKPQSAAHTQGNTATASFSSSDVKLSEVMRFIEWLQPAMAAIEQDHALPAAPQMGAGEAASWIRTIQQLEERRRESEAVQSTMEADLRDREAYVSRLTQQLQTSIAEAKSSQIATQELKQQLTTYKGLLAKVGDLAGEVSLYDGQLTSIAQEFLSKGHQLDKLAKSCRAVADALKSAANTPS